jgi:hypothetical protein
MEKQVTVSEHIGYINCLENDMNSNNNHSVITNNYYSIVFNYNSF